jgi:carboxyl-terminal processing protease
MPRKSPGFSAALLTAVVAAVSFGLCPSTRAQSPPSPPGLAASPAGSADAGDWVRRGEVLEVEHRWGEALTHYEEAVRQFPGNADLKRRFDSARLHYDLGRRYSDRSYRDGLASMSFQDALDLYSEVLLKIQAHYVDAPDWKELVAKGADGLEMALGEPVFVQANSARAGEPAQQQFRQELHRLLGSRSIRSRSDASQAVAVAAGLARDRLGIEPAAAVMEFVCGAANSLDPYSTYLTPDQLSEVYSQIEGHFVGLGVELKAVDGVLAIVRVIPNSPAKQGGLRQGDRIVAVGGRPVREITTDRAANLLQGQQGTTVKLSVVRPGAEPREVTLRRQRVEVPSVDEVQMLDPAQGIAYLKLVCFQKTTHRDLEAALWNLHRMGMRGLVIDLRGNPGGLLAAAVEAADLFLARGVIVTTRGRNAEEDYAYTAREPGTWDVPLVVLVDQDSASAAEIFAGAIRDHNRGTIVGTRSYGKGSIQGIFPLGVSRAGLRLTTAKFYSPSGYPYTGIGVQPHVAVRQAARPIDGALPASPASGSDAILAAALQAARQALPHR